MCCVLVSSLLSSASPSAPPAPTNYLDLVKVTSCYHDLRKVFNRMQATAPPPHREYNCAIDLLPGMAPLKGSLYFLYTLKREAVDRYITSSLTTGIIRPSSPPAEASFFFVKKKDKTL